MTPFRNFFLVTAICQLAVAVAQSDHEPLQRSLETGEWAREPRSISFGDLKTLLDSCDGCKSVLKVLAGIVKDGDETFLSLGRDLCTSGTEYDADFCHGVVEREGPMIASIMRDMEVGSESSLHFCVTFFGVCDIPRVDAWTVPLSSCPVDHTAAYEASSERTPLQVIHYSDIHVDPLYEKGASSKCGKPTCCRSYTHDAKPGITQFPAGPYGDHNCDVPTTLEMSMYEFIKHQFPTAAFTLFTGDIVDHSLHNTSKIYNENLISHAYNAMNEHDFRVYGTAGNHEAHPANIFEPQSVGNDTQWVYNSLARSWSRSVSNSSLQDAVAWGAYSTKYPEGNLRIISLNTNMYYRYNFALYQTLMEQDPNGQLTWLVKELEGAEKASENVYIIGHMPMGSSDALPNGSNYFDQIVRRFSPIIKGMFFGHTHVDHFQISYSDYVERTHPNALAVSYICPSLTPTSGQPSFRVYDVDPDTFAVLDAHTYIADMEDPAFQTSGPVWKKFYSAKETYGRWIDPPMTDVRAELSPSFWHNVTNALDKNETLFDQYMSRKSRGWKADTKCRGDCKKLEICGLRAARSEDNCWRPTPGVHFSRRDESQHNHGHHDDCGASISARWLSALLRRQDMREMVQERFLAVGAKIQPIVKRREPSNSPSQTATASMQQVDCRTTSRAGATTSAPRDALPSAKANKAAQSGPTFLGTLLGLAACLL